jgi:hypothetical protein
MRLIIRSRDESGSILLVALLAFVLIGTVLGSYLARVVTEQRLTTRSLLWNSTVPVIDAGIEEALAHLNRNVLTNDLNPHQQYDPKADGWREVGTDVYEMSRNVSSWSRDLTNDHYTVRINLKRPWQPEIFGQSNFFSVNSFLLVCAGSDFSSSW